MKTLNKEQIEKAKQDLLKDIAIYDTIYLNLKHTSKSGMYRVFSLYIADNEKKIFNIDRLVSEVLQIKYDNKHYGLGVKGCGMDMGFYIVNSLSNELFGKDNALKYSYL